MILPNLPFLVFPGVCPFCLFSQLLAYSSWFPPNIFKAVLWLELYLLHSVFHLHLTFLKLINSVHLSSLFKACFWFRYSFPFRIVFRLFSILQIFIFTFWAHLACPYLLFYNKYVYCCSGWSTFNAMKTRSSVQGLSRRLQLFFRVCFVSCRWISRHVAWRWENVVWLGTWGSMLPGVWISCDYSICLKRIVFSVPFKAHSLPTPQCSQTHSSCETSIFVDFLICHLFDLSESKRNTFLILACYVREFSC